MRCHLCSPGSQQSARLAWLVAELTGEIQLVFDDFSIRLAGPPLRIHFELEFYAARLMGIRSVNRMA
jgi:hypothetical protein